MVEYNQMLNKIKKVYESCEKLCQLEYAGLYAIRYHDYYYREWIDKISIISFPIFKEKTLGILNFAKAEKEKAYYRISGRRLL